jgi:hypothetical protein
VADRERDDEPSFSELFSAALRGSAFAKLSPGQMPAGADLLAAVGGIRGLVESILPGLAFLIAYSVGKFIVQAPDAMVLLWAVGIPLALSIVFLLARLVLRQPLRSALTGILVAAVTAALALITGRSEDSFVPGIIINAVSLLVLLATLIARWPLVGLIVGAISGDLGGWRSDPPKRRVLTVTTWFWVGLFALRLGVEVPLYLAGETAWLAVAKLVLGVPAYALLLWITWLMVGSAFRAAEPTPGSEPLSDPRADGAVER